MVSAGAASFPTFGDSCLDFEGELNYSDSEAGSHDGWSLEEGEIYTERRGLTCFFDANDGEGGDLSEGPEEEQGTHADLFFTMAQHPALVQQVKALDSEPPLVQQWRYWTRSQQHNI